jgi:16S rRNA G527 N7-methylase RsmG
MIPSNRKTLFLRNLEKVLTNHEVMCECRIEQFRNNTCYEILYLLENYLSDVENQTNELMMSQYKLDSFWTRFDDDRRKLSIEHRHQ